MFTNMDTDPWRSLDMQVAQLPDSQENGGDMPICRAACRIVVPGRWSVLSVRPSTARWRASGVACWPGGTWPGPGAGAGL